MKFKLMMTFVYVWLSFTVFGFSLWSLVAIKTSYVYAGLIGCCALIQIVTLVKCIQADLEYRRPKPLRPENVKPEPRRVLHGDWGWFLETKNKAAFKFIRYTWRHRIRLLIGIDGNMGSGEYTFKRVKFRGRLHMLLNKVL